MFVYAETPAALLDSMSQELARVRDPRARHWLVLPGRGRAEAVLKQWARTSGIASHSQEIQIRELIEQAAAGTGSRFNFDRLRVAIASELPLVCQQEGLTDCPVPKDAVLSPVSAAVLDWASLLARAMDDGLLCRENAERWPEGSLLEALFKTQRLTEAIRAHLGTITPAQFEANARTWMEDWTRRGGLPYLWIGLDAGLPLAQYQRFVQLVKLVSTEHPGRLNLFALTPSFEYWADCLTRGRSRRMPGGNPEEADPDCYPGGMLWAFGRASQDLHRQLSDTLMAEGDGGVPFESQTLPDSLLGSLQLSCRRAAPPEAGERRAFNSEDASLTVHSCRSTLRELELCRDRILQARHEMDDLRYEDILLLLADPKRQAPFIEAALRADASHGPAPLPFRLQGAGQAVPSALAEGIGILLEKIRGRLGLEDLQILIEHPLISTKFGFREANEDGQDLVGWLADAQFRWGLDAAHRQSFQSVPENRWNLCWALHRLGLGALIGAEQLGKTVTLPADAGETVPLERASGLSLASLAQLARFATALSKARAEWGADAPLPLAEWNTRLLSLVETFLDHTAPGPAQHHTTLVNAVLPSLENAMRASEATLLPDAYLRLLEEKLASISESGSRGIGGICVADLRQYAGVPARMILVAGLDDGAFPGRDDRPAWNPLSKGRKTGDPSVRNTDRHALLLAVLACKERLVLSYQGGSDDDSKERPPSTALADLLQVVDSTLAPAPGASSGKKPHSQILFHHALNGFSRSAFLSGQSPSQGNYLHCDFRAAGLLNAMQGLPPYRGPWANPLPPEDPGETSTLPLDSLHQLVREPAQIFLQRLGISLPESLDTIESGDLIELDGLKKWVLRSQLLTETVEGRTVETAVHRMEVSGILPRSEIGNELVQKLKDELPPAPVPAFTAGDRISSVLRLSVPHPLQNGKPWLLEGTLKEGWYRKAGSEIAHFFCASEVGLKYELSACIDALALAASFADNPEAAPKCAKTHFKSGKSPVLQLPPPARAREILSALLPIFTLARQMPLPFWPGTATAIWEGVKTQPDPDSELLAEALEAGLIKWSEPGFNSGAPADSESQATRYAFRGCLDPLSWNPALPQGSGLPFNGLPLAWNLVAFFHTWKSNAGI